MDNLNGFVHGNVLYYLSSLSYVIKRKKQRKEKGEQY